MLFDAVNVRLDRVVEVELGPDVPATKVMVSRWKVVLAAVRGGGVENGWSVDPDAAPPLRILLASTDHAGAVGL
jgi:hypothetical protein